MRETADLTIAAIKKEERNGREEAEWPVKTIDEITKVLKERYQNNKIYVRKEKKTTEKQKLTTYFLLTTFFWVFFLCCYYLHSLFFSGSSDLYLIVLSFIGVTYPLLFSFFFSSLSYSIFFFFFLSFSFPLSLFLFLLSISFFLLSRRSLCRALSPSPSLQTYVGRVLLAVNPWWSRTRESAERQADERESERENEKGENKERVFLAKLYSPAVMDNFMLQQNSRELEPHVFAIAQEAFR